MDYIRQLINEALLMEGVASAADVNNAIDNLTQVEIRYLTDGKPIATGRRIIYPVAYGLTKSGNPVIRAFEPYGDTSSKVPAWKFFRLDRIKNWRPLKKTFRGENLEGFNENGDETMSIVYNIANISGRPQHITFPKPDGGPITKRDINPNGGQPQVEPISNLKQGEKYGSEDVVNDLMRYVPQDNDPLKGIKQQISKPKQMVSPEMLKQIEKDNEKRKLKQTKKLDNTIKDTNLVTGEKESSGIIPAGSTPITKNDIQGNKNYEISNDDLEQIKKQWGLS